MQEMFLYARGVQHGRLERGRTRPVYKSASSGFGVTRTRTRPVHLCHRQKGEQTASRLRGSFSPNPCAPTFVSLNFVVTISPTVGTEKRLSIA